MSLAVFPRFCAALRAEFSDSNTRIVISVGYIRNTWDEKTDLLPHGGAREMICQFDVALMRRGITATEEKLGHMRGLQRIAQKARYQRTREIIFLALWPIC